MGKGRPEAKFKHNDQKTKHKTKDLDEIQNDMKPENAEKLLNRKVDHDIPGGAQNYCLHCARHFISPRALEDHFKSKPHRRKLKTLETEAYSLEEAERAAGMGSYVSPRKRKVEPQPRKEPAAMELQDGAAETETAETEAPRPVKKAKRNKDA